MSDPDAKVKFYETNIINPTINVYALSDIHGDIQSFIILLRDCAKVIRKKNPIQDANPSTLMKYDAFDSNKYDENMEDILRLDLNTDEAQYIKDLNYEWCGENTHVVICGDIIDPFRLALQKFCMKTDPSQSPCSYYPQIELKILMFINALNEQAARTCGKIIKLFGNHELDNILSVPDLYKGTYFYPQDHQYTNPNYYLGVNRYNIFRVGQPGFKLLIEGGCGILVKINNTIFVHGNLVDTYDNYDSLNQYINNQAFHNITYQDNWNNKFRSIFNYLREDLSSVLDRRRGDDKLVSARITDFNNGNSEPLEKFCDALLESFNKFKGNGSFIKEDVNNLKLVIGHCIQSNLSIQSSPVNPLQGTTYSKKIDEDHVMEVFGNEIYSGIPVFDVTNDRTKIFGITMECLIPETNVNRLYRVDIGSSRGMDAYMSTSSSIIYPETVADENKFLYSKTPQILKLNTDGSINIIKSKMRNTRIHLPRPDYENFIVTNSIQELDINKGHKYYEYKYLKYKNKYLQLKYNNNQYGGGDITKDIANPFRGIKITSVEVIFILGDKTGKNFTKIIDKKIDSISNLTRYTYNKKQFVKECIDANQAHFHPNMKSDLTNLLEKFIDRYSGITGDLDITPEFNKLFNTGKFKLTLTGLYADDNIIDEFLLFNLLSRSFFNYKVEFNNYFENFNNIKYTSDCLGILVNAFEHKLCIFTHNCKLISYSCKTKKFFSCDWEVLLNTSKLYITHDGELINSDTYNKYTPDEMHTLLTVMYITVLTKVDDKTNTNFGKMLNHMQNSLNTMLLTKEDFSADLAAAKVYEVVTTNFDNITDKVMQYIFAKIHLAKYRAVDDNINIKVKNYIREKLRYYEDSDDKGTFAPIYYILGEYYRGENIKESLKFFIISAAHDYVPSMHELCYNAQYEEHSSFDKTSYEKWCKIVAYFKTEGSFKIDKKIDTVAEQEYKKQLICIPNSNGSYNSLKACNEQE